MMEHDNRMMTTTSNTDTENMMECDNRMMTTKSNTVRKHDGA